MLTGIPSQIDLNIVPASTTQLQLVVSAKTSNALVSVSLAGAYAGRFTLSTANANAQLDLSPGHTISWEKDSKSKKEGRIEAGSLLVLTDSGSQVSASTSNAAVRFTVSG